MINVLYWITRPHRLMARVRYWAWEVRNPDKPWLCPETVRFCDLNLDRSMVGLEFGSGRSTAWFAGKLKALTSIEHHPGWYDRVRSRLALAGLSNVDYRLIPIDRDPTRPERSDRASPPPYVMVAEEFADESLDLVVMDGLHRILCIRMCLNKIRPGGFLLLDDAERWPDRSEVPVPEDWPIANLASNGLKRTCIWRKP